MPGNQMTQMRRTIFKYFGIIILKEKIINKGTGKEINIKITDILSKNNFFTKKVEHYLDAIAIR